MKQFETIQAKKPKRSTFDLSHGLNTTAKMGELTPIFLEEVIPGDHWKITPEFIARVQPLVAALMHRVNIDFHFYFVPYRLIWTESPNFFMAADDGVAPNFPKFTGTGQQFVTSTLFNLGSLADHFGYPVDQIPSYHNDTAQVTPLSQLPFRAYQLIFNEYFRDQNLTSPIGIPKTSSDLAISDVTAAGLLAIRYRAWEKDSFTSALPYAQKGEPVKLPLGNVEVTGIPEVSAVGSDLPVVADDGKLNYKSSGYTYDLAITGGLSGTVSETTLNDLRTAWSIQRFKEKIMRGGSRYTEYLLNLFGVKSADSRLQRPEFLFGMRNPLQISEVIQTSQSDTTAQGNIAGHGFAYGNGTGAQYFTEHGMIIGLCSIMPKTMYQQGVPRILSKFDRFDYLIPDFAHLGEVPVRRGDVYSTGSIPVDNSTFGYNPRYWDYRSRNDGVHGDFRVSLDYWHLGRKFLENPQLNDTFISCNPSTRIFAVEDPTFSKFLLQLHFKCYVKRSLPYFGTPL